MRILVTGREGQLARSLAQRAADLPQFDLRFASRPECDLAIAGSAASAIERHRPDLVVNAAAYTAVDRAEAETDLALRINGDAAGEIAAAAALLGTPLIHLSTDYVFAGNGDRPLEEDEPISPLGAYGQSKAAGEKAVRQALSDHLILRTAWVFSPFGQNFVKTMLRLARDRDEIGVVADQVGSPTSALDLAGLILTLTERRLNGDRAGWGETYHAAGAGQASWAEVAQEVMRVAASAGAPVAAIRPIATADYPTPAKRPAWSVLSGVKLERAFGLGLPEWRTGLLPVVEQLVAKADH